MEWSDCRFANLARLLPACRRLSSNTLRAQNKTFKTTIKISSYEASNEPAGAISLEDVKCVPNNSSCPIGQMSIDALHLKSRPSFLFNASSESFIRLCLVMFLHSLVMNLLIRQPVCPVDSSKSINNRAETPAGLHRTGQLLSSIDVRRIVKIPSRSQIQLNQSCKDVVITPRPLAPSSSHSEQGLSMPTYKHPNSSCLSKQKPGLLCSESSRREASTGAESRHDIDHVLISTTKKSKSSLSFIVTESRDKK
ncbi:uncharacterized protein L203_103305 [Cryptococcus depauperatus CBS 7841]|uniref:Uncharacterized protein n=1 Tax=Cryptococcus depauperatus CBS 7841 TaxID=1295531 RepID=A0AAJ8M0L8_9TREE